MPRVRHVSEGSTVSVKEDEEESSDEEDKKSSQNTAQREKSSGFGWFSWFRSKPTTNTSPSADEDSDSTDPEVSGWDGREAPSSVGPSGVLRQHVEGSELVLDSTPVQMKQVS